MPSRKSARPPMAVSSIGYRTFPGQLRYVLAFSRTFYACGTRGACPIRHSRDTAIVDLVVRVLWRPEVTTLATCWYRVREVTSYTPEGGFYAKDARSVFRYLA